MQGGPWFGRKRFGFGLRPVSWQGWALTGGYVALAVVLGGTLAASQPWLFGALLGTGTGVFVLLAVLTSR